MTKHLITIVLGCVIGVFFASCSHPSLTGPWIEPATEGSISGDKGFTLLENGEILPINMGYAEFKTWEKSGNMIFFKGTYTGTNPHDFVDTMNIVKLDEQELVLEQAGYTVTYQRK